MLRVATREAFNKEMLRERMREMPGEGQTFYALKHYNKPFTDLEVLPHVSHLIPSSSCLGQIRRKSSEDSK